MRASQILGITNGQVRNLLSKIKLKGVEGLKRHLWQTIYLKVSKICLFVLERYSVKCTVTGMRNWLTRKGFVYNSPIKAPAKLDPLKQSAFLAKYDELKAGLNGFEV